MLEQANARNYRLAVRYLLTVRQLFDAMEQRPAFEVYLGRIRDANKRRPTFVAELARRLG